MKVINFEEFALNGNKFKKKRILGLKQSSE